MLRQPCYAPTIASDCLSMSVPTIVGPARRGGAGTRLPDGRRKPMDSGARER